MQNIFKRILSCGMALLMCLGITTVVHTTVTESYSYVADAATDYYADVTATSGTQLSGQLHDLIVKTHTTYTTYTDCKTPSKVKLTDAGSANNTVMEFYTQVDMSSSWGSGAVGTWNREHVWCQSNSAGLWGESGGGSDMHHIRPSESRVNSSRGNNKFGEVSGGSTVSYNGHTAGKVGGGVFEPTDDVKGDVARICMYVYLHYNNASNVGGTIETKANHGNLPFSNNVDGNEAAAKQLLLKWNKLDPVDDIERNRNDAVCEIQGNRNPFIDNETYADAIWGNGTATEVPVDPSVSVTSLTVSPSTVNLAVGDTYKLTATVSPSNANGSVKWNSNNPIVASVSSDGTVTAVSEGTAQIYATSTQDTTKKSFATVTVTNASGGSTTPTPTPTPTGGGSFEINSGSFAEGSGGYEFYTWTSGSVGGMAFIYGGAGGYMQFNSGKQKSYYLASDKPTSGPITEVTVKLSSQKSGKDGWKLLTSNTPYSEIKDGNPTDGTDHGIKKVTTSGTTWTVSGNDTYFALISDYGDKGASYLDSITVKYGASQGGTVTPTPTPSVELKGITVVPANVTLGVGETKALTVLPDPLNATADVSWTTSDANVATVSNGVVTAKGEGSATITATDKTNSSIKSTATVTVGESNAKTVTVTLKSFTLTDGYGFKDWSQDGFGGIGFIFGGTETYPASNIQLTQKQTSCYIASNVSAGAIKSITIKNGNPNNYSATWTLLTSNTPYGKVDGIPETGTNNGEKTVAQGSTATWQLDGSQNYFALTVEPNEKGFAVYLDSIVIVYEGDGQGAYVPDIDEAKLTAFHNAVEAIDTAETDLEVFDAKIKAAEAILDTLTADEKVEVLDDINALANAKILYEIMASQGDEEVDDDKVLAFMFAVDAIDNDGTIEERETQIAAADDILETMNVAEKLEATEDIAKLNAAKIKLEQDKKKAEEIVTPEPPVVNQKLVAFHNAVEAIDDDGTVEEREAQIAAADEIYATLTSDEKAEVLDDIQKLKDAKDKLDQDKNGGTVTPTPTPDVDEEKIASFHEAVQAIPADGTLDEREEAILVAKIIKDTLNDAEKTAAADDIAIFEAAYAKYLEDLNGTGGDEPIDPDPVNPNPPVTPDDPVTDTTNVNAFKTAVGAIPANGTLEAKFNAIAKAILAYQKLSATEKTSVSTETATLQAAITAYNQIVSSYNNSAETANDIAVGSLKNFF